MGFSSRKATKKMEVSMFILKYLYIYVLLCLGLHYPAFSLSFDRKCLLASIPIALACTTSDQAVFIPILVFMAISDARTMEVPYLSELVLAALFIARKGNENLMLACIFTLPFFIFSLLSKIGGADVILIFLFTLYLGMGCAYVLIIASSLCLLVNATKEPSRRIPFIPYLCIGFSTILLLSEAAS